MVETVRVVYVGADLDAAESVAEGLEGASDRIEAIATDDPEDARGRIAAGGVDCIASAYRLSGTDGVAFLRTVRKSHPWVPFVLFAEGGSEAVASEAIAAGVTDYVPGGTGREATLADRIVGAVERNRTDRDADERMQALEAVLETVPLILCMLDESGTVTRAGGSALGTVGIDPDEAVGRHASELFDGSEAVLDGFERALDGETASAVVESHGAVFRTWFRPLRSAGEEVSGAVILAVDVTERRQRQRELERQNEQLERVASIISHDLRSPLQVAKGHLELAEQTGDPESFRRTREAQERIETIVEDVMTLARTGRTVTETTRVELDDIARDAWKTVDTSRIRLIVDGNCEMDAERARLRQLFENLFRNAVEHGFKKDSEDGEEEEEETDEDQEVTVTVGSIELLPTSTRATSDAVKGFYVADDGPGIPRSDREEALEWGYSTSEDGTGFGLAIVEGIAEAHGWEVSVTESYQGGFRIEFTGADFRQVR